MVKIPSSWPKTYGVAASSLRLIHSSNGLMVHTTRWWDFWGQGSFRFSSVCVWLQTAWGLGLLQEIYNIAWKHVTAGFGVRFFVCFVFCSIKISIGLVEQGSAQNIVWETRTHSHQVQIGLLKLFSSKGTKILQTGCQISLAKQWQLPSFRSLYL